MRDKISISGNRVAVQINDKQIAQFVVWDLQKSQHEDLINQITLAFSICDILLEVQKHLRINGYDATLEDLYDA